MKNKMIGWVSLKESRKRYVLNFKDSGTTYKVQLSAARNKEQCNLFLELLLPPDLEEIIWAEIENDI